MTKHLPAPWEFSSSAIWAISPWNARIAIAHVHTFSATNGISSEANGRLIAAAPELLAGLIVLLKRYVELAGSGDCGFWDPETEDEVIAAHAAITKATGGAA